MAETQPPTSAEKVAYAALALTLLAVVRTATAVLSTRDSIELSAHLAELFCTRSARVGGERRNQRHFKFIEIALCRASDFLPTVRCLQRAIAGRLWLAHHGVETEIVLGVRHDAETDEFSAALEESGPFRGHAWLELPSGHPDLPTALLDHPRIPYRILYRH